MLSPYMLDDEDPIGKRRSRSFSKADIRMIENMQNALANAMDDDNERY